MYGPGVGSMDKFGRGAMLKKAKAEIAKEPTPSAKELSQSVLNSSHQIWLAGLGAFSRAQAEGMKVFETLVKQGERLEERTRRAAADTAAAARGAATAKAKEMQQMAGGTWDKLEHVFEDRVERALSKLGVYTQNDIQRLAARVDELSEAVNQLLKATGVKPKPPASSVKARVKGAARAPVRTAANTVKAATKAVKATADSATKTAGKTIRRASKAAKAALK
jgi:poly(hydroxyalkanoate) granule-associated protein